MSNPVITVDNLSKAYRIGLKEEIPDTLMSALTGFAKAPFKKFRDLRRLDTFGHAGHDEEDLYWALKDVSFEVQEGEVLGVIGRNGAGKSTLLKILSRITEPTRGRAVIRGRVSSLLEVGTGFHPELSGRENVYLNGTILGMTKREIDRKFNEIVDFSGVEKFLDTPIKRYSSGMKVRLAFAVAAHLEPEILIIDEVLAVGDAEFQKKCMGKMQDVARGGRTVLFVSHDMAAIESLCTHGLVLRQGCCSVVTAASDAIQQYRGIKDTIAGARKELAKHSHRRSGLGPTMTSVTTLTDGGVPAESIRMGQHLSLAVEFRDAPEAFSPVLGAVIKSSRGHALFGVNNRFVGSGHCIEKVTAGTMVCDLGDVPLLPGTYGVDLYLGDEYRDFDVVEDATAFTVESSDFYGTGKLPPSGAGPIRWAAAWRLKGVNENHSCQSQECR